LNKCITKYLRFATILKFLSSYYNTDLDIEDKLKWQKTYKISKKSVRPVEKISGLWYTVLNMDYVEAIALSRKGKVWHGSNIPNAERSSIPMDVTAG
jgi:hypothetical protein